MSTSLIQSGDLKREARAAGIDLIGVTSARPIEVAGLERRSFDPGSALPGARAVILAGFNIIYPLRLQPSEPGRPRGRFTPYGSRLYVPMTDYCRRIVGAWLAKHGYQAASPPDIPIKPAAARAGLGRYGKNGVLLTEEFGSWIMFEGVITDAPLDYGEHELEPADCGDCDICLKACPTGAIREPFLVEREKCITNWLWGAHSPPGLRHLQENRLFGCGLCLASCPKNAGLATRDERHPVQPDDRDDSPELIPMLAAGEEHYRRSLPSFPLQAGVEALRGNAVIALGNSRDPAAVDSLVEVLRQGTPQNRAYAAWSLQRIGGPQAERALRNALADEGDTEVAGAIRSALGG